MQHRLVYGDKDFIEDGGFMTAHSQIDAFTYLVAKGGTGCVGLVDTRTGFDKTVQVYIIYITKIRINIQSVQWGQRFHHK